MDFEVRRNRGEQGYARVDVIDTNEVVLDQNLAFFWCWNWEVGFILQDFDTACFLDENTAHCFGD